MPARQETRWRWGGSAPRAPLARSAGTRSTRNSAAALPAKRTAMGEPRWERLSVGQPPPLSGYDRLIMERGSVDIRHLTREELEAGVSEIRRAPRDEGVLELIVRRPKVNEREVLDVAELNLDEGVAGDTWKVRSSMRTPDGSRHPDMQLNIINARVIALIAQDRSRWPLAGDQLYVDLDLAGENLPPWTRLQIGTAIVEVTDQPHTGCAKFVSRFGVEAMKFVNSPLGRSLNLRGINARVVQPGVIRAGDVVRKMPAAAVAPRP